jgi:hypothetical protein
VILEDFSPYLETIPLNNLSKSFKLLESTSADQNRVSIDWNVQIFSYDHPSVEHYTLNLFFLTTLYMGQSTVGGVSWKWSDH